MNRLTYWIYMGLDIRLGVNLISTITDKSPIIILSQPVKRLVWHVCNSFSRANRWREVWLIVGGLTWDHNLISLSTPIHHHDVEKNRLFRSQNSSCRCGRRFAFSSMDSRLRQTRRLLPHCRSLSRLLHHSPFQLGTRWDQSLLIVCFDFQISVLDSMYDWLIQ